VSWDCATGVVNTPVFEDNVKAWSGDHCVDPRLVPGVIFCNYPIENEDPALIDIAPTALRLFGLKPAPFMEGQSLFDKSPLGDAHSGNGAGADASSEDSDTEMPKREGEEVERKV
jgi:hypothetical protein